MRIVITGGFGLLGLQVAAALRSWMSCRDAVGRVPVRLRSAGAYGGGFSSSLARRAIDAARKPAT
ncbi:hypothetical protein UK15_38170 [Streptomyces variegatus]|jgi:prephenate dehydrogenase|uniref:Uncharacterized protein n=1 Tax=Streptomyces variegatus TaxID=284040 RepID=A0A0M2GGL0_9ACTN|nr:hypothetical protein UK15_38170 [Streptomyces variegatus]